MALLHTTTYAYENQVFLPFLLVYDDIFQFPSRTLYHKCDSVIEGHDALTLHVPLGHYIHEIFRYNRYRSTFCDLIACSISSLIYIMYNKYLSESEGFSAIGLCIKANIVPCSTGPLQTD